MEDRLDEVGRAGTAAWTRIKKAQSRMWGDWMTVGEALLEGRRWAMHQADTNKPEGKAFVMAYSEYLKRYKLDDMDKSDRAKLLQLMEERPGVEEWRAGLKDYERRNLNHPVIVWRKWTAATRVKRPRSRTAAVAGSEHGRAQAMIEQQQERILELEQELAATRESGNSAPAETIELRRELIGYKSENEELKEQLATREPEPIDAQIAHVLDIIKQVDRKLREPKSLHHLDLVQGEVVRANVTPGPVDIVNHTPVDLPALARELEIIEGPEAKPEKRTSKKTAPVKG